MVERNLMYMDFLSVALVFSCFAMYVLGYIVFSRNSIPKRKENFIRLRIPPTIYIIIPSAVGFALNTVSIIILLKNNPWVFGAFAAGAGQTVKEGMDSEGALLQALPLLIAAVWWGWWNLKKFEHENGIRMRVARTFLLAATISAMLTAVLKMARYELMPLVFGLFVISTLSRANAGHLSFRTIIVSTSAILTAIITLFIGLSFLRGMNTFDELAANLLGYGPASYNRLSAILHDHTYLEYGGTNYYVFSFLSHIPILDRVADISNLIGLPDRQDVWLSEFYTSARAGLDPAYIWVSIFGYLYAALGAATPLYFFFLGGLLSILWNSIQRNHPAAVVLYPWAAFSVATWFSFHILASYRLVTFVIVGFGLSVFEWLFSPTARRTSKGNELPLHRSLRKLGLPT